jgi:hypothetical protein
MATKRVTTEKKSTAPKRIRSGDTIKPLEPQNHSMMLIDKEAVARRAYEIFQARGNSHGRDVDDWLAAERELGRR